MRRDAAHPQRACADGPTVREEVSVGKRQVQNTKSISDDVKHEELRVEKDGDISVDEPRRRKPA
ncbi:MAG: hypothetical protein DMG60_00205 [Acidobacteria bacterium]|nr:MAG: hypothetical protein DMG60_00205 [Acidobacteriota bacterium]